jgi:pimeloyl-ACP methyl ester carboxylesterase
MRAAHIVEIQTPKGCFLNGIWLGPKKTKTVYIWIHGLSSTVFSKHDIAARMVDKDTAVLFFNNRGHDQVAKISTVKGTRIRGGSAHEKFVDCLDDIDGAITCAKRNGAKKIFLVGHSTGCQKSVYWASKRKKGVSGIVLLAPISDYAATVMLDGKAKIQKAMKIAKAFIKKGNKHQLLPESVWSHSLLADAQRFVSLYSGKGPEEIFTYWTPQSRALVLEKVRVPILAVLAESDEYADRPASQMQEWFLKHIYEGEVTVLSGATHSFRSNEKDVARLISAFSRG